MEIKNAKITSTTLGHEDHGIFTCMIYLDYGDSSGQGFGGYALDIPKKDTKGKFLSRVGTSYGMQFIIELLKVVGVDKWEDLPGEYIRVEAEHTEIHRIGNLLRDEWFDPKQLTYDG